MSALLLGILIGVRHALDADHVVAVAAIVSRARGVGAAARIGALWGAGHSGTVLAVGGSIVALRLAVPARLALAFEFAVALMLIALGVMNLARRERERARSPIHPAVVGSVHGLAGSAALALLVLAAFPDTAAALTYLAMFSLGSIGGMIGVTLGIAVPARALAARGDRAARFIRVGAGVVSVAFGLVLAHHVAVERQLFGAAPVWAAE